MAVMTSKPAQKAVPCDPRWVQLSARDKAADGQFCYAVATTGVYCRPSCPSRAPNPRNVRFFGTPAAAQAAGFRACRRCNPNGLSVAAQDAAIMAKACRSIEQAETPPALAALAAAADLSPAHFHRRFKATTGVTPKAYAEACRAARVRQELGQAGSVTQALHGAGFGSSGRFYAASTALLGMTPGRYQSGGAGEQLRFAIGQCSLGAVLVACSAKGVAAILLGDDPDALARGLQDRFPRASLIGGDAGFEAMVARVVGCVESPGQGLDLPLDVRGTAFQQRVWQALRGIPPGETASYAQVAARIGAPGAVRAVGAACAANALAVAIPCHRVVRGDGGLSGYRWGVDRKRALLAREAGQA